MVPKRRKKVTELKKYHLAAVSSWYKSMNRCADFKNNIKLVKKYHKAIGKHIAKHYTNIGTKRNNYAILGVILNYLNHPKIAEIYLLKMDALNIKVIENTKKQEMSEREKQSWLNHDQLLQFRDKLEKVYNKDKDDLRNCYCYLVISWFTMRPPTRLEIGDMEIINDESEIKPKKNYLLKHNNNKYELIIQIDKVYKSHDTLRDIVGPKLSKIITESLEHFPRTYFITTLRNINKPLGKSGLSKFITRMYGHGLTLGMMRSAYITKIYDTQDDINTVENLARLMRHGTSVSRLSYRKYEHKKKLSLYFE